jgi:COP9 signalosome complex subunit 5
MYVMDVYGLPVVGTETRVNATQEADGFMIDH